MRLVQTGSAKRAAFEAWYRSTHTNADLMRGRKGYVSETTRRLWRLWQYLTQEKSDAP